MIHRKNQMLGLYL